jgi:regulator of protease activity HflC (stomatin/prohibitin superfamily)
MKRSSFSIALIMFVLITALFTGCNRATPNGDQEAVLVMKPWIFGHGGVDMEPVSSGSEWCAPTTDILYFSIVPMQIAENFDDLITDDNNPVDFDVYVGLQIRRGQSALLYTQKGADWYNQNLRPFIRSLVRDRASQYKTFDLAGNREVLSAIEKYVFEELRKFIDKAGMPVDVLNITMGKVTPPVPVLEETMKTSAQRQAKLTQDARAEAERARGAAEKQKAIADDMYKNTFGMTTEQYLHLRDLEIRKEQVELLKQHPNVQVTFIQGGIPVTYPVK